MKFKRLPLDWWRLWLPVTMVALIPTLTDYLRNAYQVPVQNLWLPVALAVVIAAAVSGWFYRRFKLNRLAGLSAAVLTAAVLTSGYEPRLGYIYPLLQAIFPLQGLGGAEGAVFSLSFILLVTLLAGWAGRMVAGWAGRRQRLAGEAVTALTLVVAVAFGLQFLATCRNIGLGWGQFFYKPPPLAAAGLTAESKPDIYYIILDRYASPSVLQNQFGYDNADFNQFLQSQQFFIQPDSHNNYPYTTMSIASTLSGDYLADAINKFKGSGRQTIIPYHRTIYFSPVIEQLKQLGYSYWHIGSWYDATNQAPLANHLLQPDGQLTILGKTFNVGNFGENELNQSLFWRFIPKSHNRWLSYRGKTNLEMIDYGLGQLRKLADQPAGGRFIMAHLLIPHDPYFYNADGSLNANTGSDDIGEPIKQKYLGQVQFINGQVKPILEAINRQSSGKAVVVLQADEGPYPIQLNDGQFDETSVDTEVNDRDMRQWSTDDLKMKFGNLAAYHLPGVSDQDLAKAADPVNIFRLIFNTYFGGRLDYLPRCYYAYPNGRAKPLVYADITRQLTGQANDSCAADGTGKR